MVSRPKKLLFVEGGGDQNDALKTECRRAVCTFLKRAGFEMRMPRIVACGGRTQAYARFCTAISSATKDEVVVLLVDSEASVSEAAKSARPWEHVKRREGDGWDRPDNASDDDLHFMVECMENWFLADKEKLGSFFGQGFVQGALPANPQVEQIPKLDVSNGLKNATRKTEKKGEYGKGAHSFKLLALIDPSLVRKVAPYAERLLTHLDKVL